MALTAQFVADFASFTEACAKAEVSLKGIESGASKVESQLNKMAGSFSGTKLIQQAALTVEAVNRIGGISSLSESQLKRFAATTSEAADKLQKLAGAGQSIPPAMQKIIDASKAAQLELEKTATASPSLFGKLEGALGAVGLSLSGLSLAAAGAKLAGVATDAIALASQLHNLSIATGISTGDLQRLQFAGAQVGVGLDEIALGVQRMQRNLVDGNKPAIDAIKGLGLSVDALLKMKPADMFETLSDAISKIPDPAQRTAAAMDILGRGGAQLLPLLVGNVRELEGSFHGMSEEAVTGLKRMDDAWERFKIALKGNVGEAISALGSWDAALQYSADRLDPYHKAFRELDEDIKNLADHAAAGAPDLTKGLVPSPAALEELIFDLDRLQKANDETTRKDIAAWEREKAAIQAISETLSGVTITRQVSEISAAVAGLGGPTKLSTEATFDLGKQLDELRLKGAALPAPLLALADKYADVIQKQDEWNDTLERNKVYQQQSQRAMEELFASMEADAKHLDALSKALDKMIVPFREFIASSGLPEITLKLDAMTAATMGLTEAEAESIPKFKEAAAYMQAHGATLDQAIEHLKKYAGLTNAQADSLRAASKETKDFDTALSELAQSFAFLSQISGGAFGGIVKDIGTVISAMQTAEKSLKAIQSLMEQTGHSLSPQVRGYAQTAIVGAASGAELAQLTGTRSGATGALEGAGAGAAAGAAYGSVVPGIGTAVGAGIGALAGAIGGYFQAKKAAGELKDANNAASASIADMQKQLVSQYGGLQDIDRLGKQVGVDLIGAWGDQSIAGLAHFQALTTEFQKKVEALNAAVQAFGLTWQDLAPSAQIDAISGQIDDFATKWDVLKTAGYDLTKVSEKSVGALLTLIQNAADAGADLGHSLDTPIFLLGQMGTISDTNAAALNAYLGHALSAGEKIPSALEPVLQKLIEMGKLTEDNARAMLGLSGTAGPAFADVKAAADRYGLSLDKLGSKVGQLDINEQAKQISADWETLISAGADVGAVLDGMKEKAQAVVTEALKFGGQIPASMKPLLQALADAGDLTDADGNKMSDLSKLTFAEDLTKSIGSLVDVLKKIFGITTDDLPAGFDAMAKAGQDAAAKITGPNGLGATDAAAAALQQKLKDDQAWKQWAINAGISADAIIRHIDGIPTSVDVSVNYDYSSSGSTAPPAGSEPGGPNPNNPTASSLSVGGLITASMARPFAVGGIVTPTAVYAATGGQVVAAAASKAMAQLQSTAGNDTHGAVFVSAGGPTLPAQYFTVGNPFASGPKGTDTVPAWLTPGERVLSVNQNRAFETLVRSIASSSSSSQVFNTGGAITPEHVHYLATGAVVPSASAGALSHRIEHFVGGGVPVSVAPSNYHSIVNYFSTGGAVSSSATYASIAPALLAATGLAVPSPPTVPVMPFAAGGVAVPKAAADVIRGTDTVRYLSGGGWAWPSASDRAPAAATALIGASPAAVRALALGGLISVPGRDTYGPPVVPQAAGLASGGSVTPERVPYLSAGAPVQPALLQAVQAFSGGGVPTSVSEPHASSLVQYFASGAAVSVPAIPQAAISPAVSQYFSAGAAVPSWVPTGTALVHAMPTPTMMSAGGVVPSNLATYLAAGDVVSVPPAVTLSSAVRSQAGGVYNHFEIAITAWDGKSVDTWLDSGGDVKITKRVVRVAKEFGLTQP